MRRDDQPIRHDGETTGYTFNFQISSSGGRRACSVKVQAPNIHDATRFFRQNWPMIEDGIRLDVPDRSALAADPA
jgi:hypothetical protein